MKITIQKTDGKTVTLAGAHHVRYNVQRGMLVLHRFAEEGKISCPLIYKVPAAEVLSITSEVEERTTK